MGKRTAEQRLKARKEWTERVSEIVTGGREGRGHGDLLHQAAEAPDQLLLFWLVDELEPRRVLHQHHVDDDVLR